MEQRMEQQTILMRCQMTLGTLLRPKISVTVASLWQQVNAEWRCIQYRKIG